MKTKWGSCNPEAARILINLELAKKHPDCLDYVVVHEMTHLFERHHGDRFVKLLNGFLPNWQRLRNQLDQAPLDAQEWS
jgi:predicted metal-dependent hydrolase